MADLADKDDVAEKDEAAPYFEEEERAKASAHTPLRPRLIHEIIREEGEAELFFFHSHTQTNFLYIYCFV